MIDERVGGHFWLSEFIRSFEAVRHGLDNTPKATELANLRNVLAPGMERVRGSLGVPVLILSGYRSPDVNAAVRGSATSQHMQGLAADFVAPAFGSARTIARHLMERSGEIRFDQLIYEGSWVHVSFAAGKLRSEVLTAHFMGGQVTYSQGLA